MEPLSLGSLDYRILPASEAIVEPCNYSVTTLFPRNCVAHDGNRIPVAHLVAGDFAEIIIIPHSLHTIFNSRHVFTHVKSLIFEFGSSPSLDQLFNTRS
jgi:hypothetical protein